MEEEEEEEEEEEDIHWGFFLQTSKSAIGFTGCVYRCRSVLENTKVTTSFMT
jgi:hypothetical protein